MAGGTTPQGSDPGAKPQDAVPAPAPQSPAGGRGIHDSQTVTAMPAASGTPQPPSPQAPSPYAPPAPQHPQYPQQGPVPPPPVSPAGPGLPAAAYGHPAPGPQQAPYGYPAQQPMAAYPQAPYGWAGGMPMQPSNGLGVTGMVTGIVSAVLCLFWPVSIITGILGVVFGFVGRSKVRRGEATNGGQALAGIICGAFGLLMGVGVLVLVVILNATR
ncbi:DUF4190 domain-containing protein [Streptomyces sp. NPDC050145]|uniref:DUF4190 domain-containing protein n=1 Tax=Streptomyces sp. NPDC050145 TaxID=3365602 RepID=UPI0037AB0F91